MKVLVNDADSGIKALEKPVSSIKSSSRTLKV
jgi:hypothetical protein